MIDYMSQIAVADGSKLVKIAEMTGAEKHIYPMPKGRVDMAIVAVVPDVRVVPQPTKDMGVLDALSWYNVAMHHLDTLEPGLVVLPDPENNYERFKSIITFCDKHVHFLQDEDDTAITLVVIVNGTEMSANETTKYASSLDTAFAAGPSVVFAIGLLALLKAEHILTFDEVVAALLPAANNPLEESLREDAIDRLRWFLGVDEGGAA